jgi:hypothetical protein
MKDRIRGLDMNPGQCVNDATFANNSVIFYAQIVLT